MRYGQLRKFDIANGEGIRTSLFVTGCTHNCPGCFNEEYQSFSAGMLWDEKAEEMLIEYIKNPQVKGLTILGGEPMENTHGLIPVVQRVKKEVNKSIWIYSGYLWEDIVKEKKMKELLQFADILVDGPFKIDLKDLSLKFRGSSNQRIIDVQKSLVKGQVVEYLI